MRKNATFIFITLMLIYVFSPKLIAQYNWDKFPEQFRIKSSYKAINDSIQKDLKMSVIDPNVRVEIQKNSLFPKNPDESSIRLILIDPLTGADIGPVLTGDFKNLNSETKYEIFKFCEDCIEDRSQYDPTTIFKIILKKFEIKNLFNFSIGRRPYIPFQSFVHRYFSLFMGDRLGIPIDIERGIGISIGFSSPYGGPLETDLFEANFHILGLKIGAFNAIGNITDLQRKNSYNNVYSTLGIQCSYAVPVSNFVEVGFQYTMKKISQYIKDDILKKTRRINDNGTIDEPMFLEGIYINGELRYPFGLFGGRAGKGYIAYYQNEAHLGIRTFEFSLGNYDTLFDLYLDYMFYSKERRNQFNFSLLLSNSIFSEFGKDTFAFGPALSFGPYGFIKGSINLRIKLNEEQKFF